MRIKRFVRLCMMFMVLFVMGGCDWLDGSEGGGAPVERGTVSGKIVSTETGEAIPGASIRAGDAGTISVEDGTYSLSSAVGERVVVHIDAAGFAETFQIAHVTNGETAFLDVQLLPIGVAEVLTVASGGTVSVPNSSAQVNIPAGGLIPVGGGAASVNVNVALTAINPAIDADIMPGDYTGMLSGDSAPVSIESFGALLVDVRDDNGERYTLIAGQTASVRIPVGTLSTSPPATIPLLVFDESSGLWVEEGIATLQGTAPDQFYTGTVERFGFWNADQRMNTVFVSGCVRDTADQPVANVRVKSKGINYSGSSSAFTGSDGNFRVAMRRDALATISVNFLGQDGKPVITTTNVGPFSEDSTLADCIVTEPVPLQVIERSLPSGRVGTVYNARLVAANGTKSYAWSITFGNLPTGLTLDSVTGQISGTPTTAGTFNGTIQVQDSSTPIQSADTSFFIFVTEPAPFRITSLSLPAGVVSTVYNASLNASNGIQPYTWSIISGVLPTGLNLDGTSGQISGIPTTSGIFPLTIQAEDSRIPAQSRSAIFTVTISPPNTAVLTVTTGGNGSGMVTSNITGISCGLDCTEAYPIGEIITLTATPLGDSSFTGWSGACTGTGSCIVSMDFAKSVSATFVPDLGLSVILADSNYTVMGMTSSASVEVPGNLGAIMFPADSSSLYLVGASESSTAALYSVPVTRDTNGRINLLGKGSVVFSQPNMDAGLTVKPGSSTLFFTRYPNNVLSERVGTTITDYPLGELGVPSSVGGATFVPSTLPNGGNLLVSTYSTGQVYTIPLTDNGDGTFAPNSASLFVDLPDGAGGAIDYIPSGTYAGDLIYVNWSGGTIDIVDIDPATGFPFDAETNLPTLGTANPKITPFASGLGVGPWGLTFDPISNDFFLTTWGGTPSNTIIQITGFPPPS